MHSAIELARGLSMGRGCEICGFVAGRQHILLEVECWMVFLHPDQYHLGRSVVTLKRHCAALSQVNAVEWREFEKLVGLMEMGVSKAFRPDLFNWTCLMNLAFQEEPPQPHVHWHLRPRYRDKRNVEGWEFEDREFGHHYDEGKASFVEAKVFCRIESAIKKVLQGH